MVYKIVYKVLMLGSNFFVSAIQQSVFVTPTEILITQMTNIPWHKYRVRYGTNFFWYKLGLVYSNYHNTKNKSLVWCNRKCLLILFKRFIVWICFHCTIKKISVLNLILYRRRNCIWVCFFVTTINAKLDMTWCYYALLLCIPCLQRIRK